MPTITCSWAWLCALCLWKPSQGRLGACQVQSKQQRDQHGHLLLLGTALRFLPVCPHSSRSAPYRMKTFLHNRHRRTCLQIRDKARSRVASVHLLRKGFVTGRGKPPPSGSCHTKNLKIIALCLIHHWYSEKPGAIFRTWTFGSKHEIFAISVQVRNSISCTKQQSAGPCAK